MSMARRRSNVLAGAAGLLLAILAVLVILVLTSPRQGPRRAAVFRPFSADSVWNRPLPDRAPLAADSSALVGQLRAQLAADGAWIDTYQYSVPVYTVGPHQAGVPVVLDTTGGSATRLAAVFRAGVPIPRGATAAPGTDEHMVVLQPSTDTMWEFWHMHKVNGTWHARWGGQMKDVSDNPGYFTDPPDWGATATSIPLLAGLIRFGDLRSGHVDHALAIAIPKAAAAHVLPAQRSDGQAQGPDAIPEGTRFRLPANINLSRLHLPRMTLMIARAVQHYGMIVRDQSGAVTFYGQQATTGERDPYYGTKGLYGGKDPAELLQSFPWPDLRVVAEPTSKA